MTVRMGLAPLVVGTFKIPWSVDPSPKPNLELPTAPSPPQHLPRLLSGRQEVEPANMGSTARRGRFRGRPISGSRGLNDADMAGAAGNEGLDVLLAEFVNAADGWSAAGG
jgi:hypothetical protein